MKYRRNRLEWVALLAVILIVTGLLIVQYHWDSEQPTSIQTENQEDVAVYVAENEVVMSAENTEEVFCTFTGECYHSDDCGYLKSKISISLSYAQERGLRPCSRCNPPK